MRKIKVAFFAEILIEDFDGASRTMFELLRRIPKEDFEFLFITGMGYDEIESFPVIKLHTIKVPFNNTYRMVLPWLNSRKIQYELNTFDPNVIHIATPSLMGNFALRYAKRRNIPVTTIYHTHFVSYVSYYLHYVKFLSKMVEKLLSRKLKEFYNATDKMYVPTTVIADELVNTGIKRDHLKIWPRGINRHLFNPSKHDPKSIRDITGNQKIKILFASRLVWEKNLETLIKIYRIAQKTNKPYNFIIAGDGVAKEELQKAMPEACFIGKLDQEKLAVLYASCDVFVFPSVSESYGNVVVEAMASGIPCVIANGGGSASFIKSGVNGFLCSPYDPDGYIDRIEVILNEPELKEQFVRLGLEFTENLSWDTLADTYFEDLKYLATSKSNIEISSSRVFRPANSY
ncbi:MAG: glycosyltransferase family 1 protein [Saprospiraceae bacterium]|nr:glycosyltransferase family 1 protein [Saprospiraceae bacterium]